MSKGAIIIVEAIVGAGKSSLCDAYAKRYQNVVVLKEWVNDQYLAKYLANMKVEATDFQFRAQAEAILNLIEAERLAEEGKIVFIDRALAGNHTFAALQYDNGYISRESYERYMAIRAKFEQSYFMRLRDVKMIKVETWLLECTPQTAIQRIKSRNRNGEKLYTLDYLQKLWKKHHELVVADRIVNVDQYLPVSRNNVIEAYANLVEIVTV
jgi:deoxyadenosine/deoxycytidine kinase